MADESFQEKTEEATPKRRLDARKEGQVPVSRELVTAGLFLGSALFLTLMMPRLAAGMLDTVGRSFALAGAAPLDAQAAVVLLRGTGWQVLGLLAPFVLAMSAVALTVATIQARGVLSVKALGPKWKKIDPITNGKRFLGIQPWAELAKSIFKVLIIGLAVVFSLSTAWSEVLALSQQPPATILEVFRRYAVVLLATAGAAYLVFALGDYAYQIWQHEKQLRMSKEEVKREHKDSDGDPLLRARRRSLGRELARRQMFQDVATADVVIANPTHLAVALRYDPAAAAAPVVLAMGQRKIAERIKALARDADVPVVENRPLARALLANARVGSTIPPELYLAVAEVLAFVMRHRSARQVIPAEGLDA